MVLQQQFDFHIYCKWCICSIEFGRRLSENWHRNCVYIAKGGCVKINSKWAFKYCFKIISMSFLDGQSVSSIWFHSFKMSHEQIKSPIDTSTYINPTNCRCNSWIIYAIQCQFPSSVWPFQFIYCPNQFDPWNNQTSNGTKKNWYFIPDSNKKNSHSNSE